MLVSLCKNVYDDVTDFEFCQFYLTQKSQYAESETIFSNKKNSFFIVSLFFVKLENITLILSYPSKLSPGV